MTYILVLASRRSVLGVAANGRKLKVLATVCVVVVAVLAALVQTVLGWFGFG